ACSCFFFSSRSRHTTLDCDWSSDVCSSDLSGAGPQLQGKGRTSQMMKAVNLDANPAQTAIAGKKTFDWLMGKVASKNMFGKWKRSEERRVGKGCVEGVEPGQARIKIRGKFD